MEDEHGEMVKQFPKPLVLQQQDSAEDNKKKKIFARQLTHFFEDNPPLPLLPKSFAK